MRIIRRLALAAATLVALSTAAAGIALAGNFAAVTFVDGSADPPVAGEAREIRFSLLQHGVTPINYGDVQLTATLPGTDESITVPATSVGDGEWVATLTFPAEGAWEVEVTHSLYETSPATPLAVASADTAAAAASAQPWTFAVLAALVALSLAAMAAVAVGSWLERRDAIALLNREAEVTSAESRIAAYRKNVDDVADDLARRQAFIEEMVKTHVGDLPGDAKAGETVSDSSAEAIRTVDKVSAVIPEAAPLAPADEHAEEHLGPVLRLGSACPGVDGEDGIAFVVLAGELQLELVPRELALNAVEFLAGGLADFSVVLSDGELEEFGHVPGAALEAPPALDARTYSRELLHDFARAVGVAPEVGGGRLSF